MKFIYGLSKSGMSLATYLNKKNESFNCWDDDLQVRKQAKKFLKNTKLINPKKNNLDRYDKIYVSPGISTRKKKRKRHIWPPLFFSSFFFFLAFFNCV